MNGASLVSIKDYLVDHQLIVSVAISAETVPATTTIASVLTVEMTTPSAATTGSCIHVNIIFINSQYSYTKHNV